jgi:hypothetical protein
VEGRWPASGHITISVVDERASLVEGRHALLERLQTALEVSQDLERAGVKRGTVHDLRHTAASLAIMSGQSIVEVRDFLGHCSVAVTDRYSHMIDQDAERSLTLWDGYMGATLGATPEGNLPPEGQRRDRRNLGLYLVIGRFA